MKITKEIVTDILNDGGAGAIEAAKAQVEKLAAQMDLDLAGNNSKKLSTQINLKINILIDANQRTYEAEGVYSYTTPNLSNKSDRVFRDIPDPDQGQLLDSDGNPISQDND